MQIYGACRVVELVALLISDGGGYHDDVVVGVHLRRKLLKGESCSISWHDDLKQVDLCN